MSKEKGVYTSCQRIRINGKKKRVSHIVMEKILGRLLEPDEVVHHIDENPQNNMPDNLEVMTRSEHMKLHNPKDFSRYGISAADDKIEWGKYYWREMARRKGIEPRIFKIDKEIYFTILRLLSEGFLQREVAEIFDVNPSTISRIKNKKRLAHFGDDSIILKRRRR